MDNKKQIRLTESDLKQIVKESVNRILKEDVLGNDWYEKDLKMITDEEYNKRIDLQMTRQNFYNLAKKYFELGLKAQKGEQLCLPKR